MDERLYISDVAYELNRVPHTIRVWEYSGKFKEHPELMPHRDERGWRYWTREQVELMRQWIEEEDIRPGRGLRAHLRKKQNES